MGAEELSATTWLQIILLGGVVGTIGQMIRAAIGLKKMYEDAAKAGRDPRKDFSPSLLMISLMLGFASGVLAALSLHYDDDPAKIKFTMEQLLGFLAAGYAGADFIEAFMSRYLPTKGPQQDATPKVETVDTTPKKKKAAK